MRAILNGNQIKETVLGGGILENAKHSAVNAASIDIFLGPKILIENEFGEGIASLKGKVSPTFKELEMTESGYALAPGEFILAHSVEVFHLPDWLSCEYKLNSTMARLGLEHLNAGWCDAGWNGSVLTLELKNMTRFHDIIIRPGDKIGQIIFYPHDPVSGDLSYATKGSYNQLSTVSGASK